MPSASSPVRDALAGYVAGRVKAERLVIAVSSEYYGRDGRPGTRDGGQLLIDVIDRASPGIVELGTATGGPGFDIRLAERPFPQQYEAELRRAAEAVLGRVEAGGPAGEGGKAPLGVVARLVAAVRRVFSASA